jgi:prepilin-type processing-associated H-X9-DG protein
MGGATASDAAALGVMNDDDVLGPAYSQYKKMTQIENPDPVEAMTFVDESINSIDDGTFAVAAVANSHGSGPNIWQNSPTVRHGGNSAVIAFADAHAERWRWKALRTEQGLNVDAVNGGVNTTEDLRRVQNAVFRP